MSCTDSSTALNLTLRVLCKKGGFGRCWHNGVLRVAHKCACNLNAATV